jgi:mono/diheme cytochrome c family protein
MRRATIIRGGAKAGLTGLGLALLVCSTVSCGGTSLVEYEPYPVYPPRPDPIVLANPPSHPVAPAEAGKLDEWLGGHNARGGRVIDPRVIDETKRAAVTAAVDSLFGTPVSPTVASDSPAVAALGLTPVELAEGSQLYRRHCANCHGITGDGRGPAGLFVYPHPRDVRAGTMKYVSAEGGTATRDDLAKIIRDGVPGTSMPPFRLADDRTVDRLVTATIHLSLRGEVELKLLKQMAEDEPDDVSSEAKRLLDRALTRWASATAVTAPPEPPAGDDAIRRGHALFVSAKAGCVSCHDDFGRKDAYRYDAWGTAARVANLTEREMRGGATAEDVFRRVRLGISAVGMPAQPTLTDREVWDLAEFVRALPTPAKLPADVRAVIYR